jgi:Spy/CpxP family protein refolding chaperone
MFKHGLLVLMLAGLIYTVTPAAMAQDSGNSGQQGTQAGPPPGGKEHGRFDPSKRAEMMAKHLNLNADQQAKVTDILKSEQSQMESVHSDASLSQQDRHAKMMDIHKASSDQIRGVLNPDQQKKWDEMQSRHEQMQGHHPGGEMAPPSSDSQQQK